MFRELLDNTSDVVFTQDFQGHFLYVNRIGLQLFGYSKEEASAASLDVLVAPESLEYAQRMLHDTVAEGSAGPCVLDCVTKSGQRIQFEVRTHLVRRAGQPIAIQGIGRDVSESKRNEAYLNSILHTLPIAVFIKEARDLRFVLWNKFTEDLLGISAAEVMGKNDFDFFPKEQADLIHQRDLQALHGGKLVEVEEEIQTRHKGTRLLRTRKVPILDDNGQPIYLLGIAEDITDRKMAEKELAFERDLLTQLLDNSFDHIYFKDLESRFIRASLETSVRFGVTPQQLLGKRDFDYFSEEHARPAYEDEQQIIRTGQPMVGRIEKETFDDGREFWVLTTKMPLRDKQGQIMGTFGISKDITDIKQAEAKLEKVHKQLLEASRQAGMAEVATSVLHNVGNVLNSINISASLMEDQLKNSRITNVGRVASMMQQHSADLGEFITRDPKGQQLPSYLNQLSEHLSREQTLILKEIRELKANLEHVKEIVAMQQSYAKVGGLSETVKVVDLVEDALRINAGALNRHSITLIREYPTEALEVNVQKHKVLQILVNLIRNAKYACDDGNAPEKRMTVRIKSLDGGQRAQIEIADNGVGIPAENLTRIFNHGFTTRKEGHGFGLHSGALAAKELGGSLEGFSDGPGTGATFVLQLPCQPKS